MRSNSVRCISLAASVVLLAWSTVCPGQSEPDLEFAFHADKLLRSEHVAVDDVEILTRRVLLGVYERSGFSPLWSEPERIGQVHDLLGDAASHGLLPTDYNIGAVERILARARTDRSAQTRARDDIVLTESIVRYGYHRRYGKIEADKLDTNMNFRRADIGDWPELLNAERTLRSAAPNDFIELIAPAGPIYRQLHRELVRHRDIAAAGGWPVVAEGPTLRRHDEDERVAQARRRLKASGDLPADEISSAYFDAELEDAVSLFQERHALDADGVIGPGTLEAMNIPVEQRVDQLRLSLERLRWVSESNGQSMVAVNIAGFRVFFFDAAGIRWHARAMVGRAYRQTPVFRGEIAYLEFNPSWTVPPVILRNDILPAVRRDPEYLVSRGIRVIDADGSEVDPSSVNWNQYRTNLPYTLRQDPGPNNPLGTVKFVFPNEHLVFLHDTPNRELFSQAERAVSSGCIRVEHPQELAELVLDDSSTYSIAALEQIVESGETQRVFPRSNVPILILYLTASIDPRGYVRFYRDIYDRDQQLLDALNGPVSLSPPEAE